MFLIILTCLVHCLFLCGFTVSLIHYMADKWQWVFLHGLRAPLLLSPECTYACDVQVKWGCTASPVLQMKDWRAENGSDPLRTLRHLTLSCCEFVYKAHFGRTRTGTFSAQSQSKPWSP